VPAGPTPKTSSCPHRALAQIDGLECGLGGLGVEFEQRSLCDHCTDGAFDVSLRQIVPLHRLCIQSLQHAARGIAAVARARNRDVIAAGIHDHAEPPLDLRQILSVGSDQGRGSAIVIEVDDDLCFGRDLHVAVEFAAGHERG